jgi:ABC-2 type transport system ATP-binding protein
MDEAELLCDRIAFLSGGKIVAFGTPLQLRQMVADGRPLDEINMETVFMELTGRSVEEDELEEEEGQPVAAGIARDRDKEGNGP